MSRKKLRRSRTNRMVSGVIGGFADFFDIDATLLRIIFVIMCWSGFPVVIYFLLAMIMPLENGRSYHSRTHYYDDSYHTYGTRPRKEARKVEKDDEEWSDF